MKKLMLSAAIIAIAGATVVSATSHPVNVNKYNVSVSDTTDTTKAPDTTKNLAAYYNAQDTTDTTKKPDTTKSLAAIYANAGQLPQDTTDTTKVPADTTSKLY